MKLRHLRKIMALLFFVLLGIGPGIDTGHAASYTGRAAFTPWSGYWWPIQEGALIHGYKGHPSPLEKYDLISSGYYPGNATRREQELHPSDDPDVESWWGYCHAWANAAVLEEIDFKPSVHNGVAFLVGDKKGLMTLSHDQDPVRSARVDQHPEIFHRYLLDYIGENQVAFVADLDNSEEVWSYPIYYYWMEITEGFFHDDVICSITFANDFVVPDYVGTKPGYRTYNYRLYKDPQGNYTHGEWTDNSATRHPETVWVPIAQVSENQYLDADTIREIAAAQDDEAETQSELLPGHYMLYLSPDDQDTFSWDLPAVSRLTFTMVFDAQTPNDVATAFELTHNGDSIDQGQISHTVNSRILENAQAGTYLLTLTAPAANPADTFVHLYVDIQYANNVYLLQTATTNQWLGLGLSNPQTSSSMHYITYLLSQNGLPAGSVGDSIELSAGSHWSGVLRNNLPMDYFSDGFPAVVRISSQSPLNILELFGQADILEGPPIHYPQADNGFNQRVVPWLTDFYNAQSNASLALFNASEQALTCNMDYYSNDGAWSGHTDLQMAAQSYAYYSVANYPGHTDHQGWALVSDATEKLVGKNTLKTGDQLGDALPLLNCWQVLFVPHLAIANGGWKTSLTMINVQSTQTLVTLTAYHDAQPVWIEQVMLDPFEKREILVDGDTTMLSDTQVNGAWMRIEAQAPVAGFYSYQFNNASVASLPLTAENDFTAIKHVGHVASDLQTWWTGVHLLNVDTQALPVNFQAYDADGHAIAVVQKSIPALGKLVFGVRSMFPSSFQAIRSLTMEAGGPMAGATLYGSRSKNDLLSGAALE